MQGRRRGQRQWRYERMERDWSLLTSAVEYGFSKLGYTSLNTEQMRAVESVLKGKDTFVSVPTGLSAFPGHPAA